MGAGAVATGCLLAAGCARAATGEDETHRDRSPEHRCGRSQHNQRASGLPTLFGNCAAAATARDAISWWSDTPPPDKPTAMPIWRGMSYDNPDLVLAIANPVVLGFMQATTKIPLVAVAGNMVGSEIVPNLARPGGNITASVPMSEETKSGASGLVCCLKQRQNRRTPASSPCDFLGKVQSEALRKEASQLGISLEGALLDGAIDEPQIRRVFTAMERDRVDALMVIDDAGLFPHRQLIVELASKGRIPAIYAHRIFVEPGGLMAYSFDLAEMYRHAAGQIDGILRGGKPEIFLCSRPPATSSSSTSRPRRRSALKFRRRCSPAPTR